MDVKEAVKIAKTYVADLFAEERLSNLGLEEVEHDDGSGTWNVTLGFSRPWDAGNVMAGIRDGVFNRAYRVVAVRDKDGSVQSVKLREITG